MKAERVCAQCKRLLGYVDVAPVPGIDHPVSHGLCPECAKAVYRELAAMVLDGKAKLVPRDGHMVDPHRGWGPFWEHRDGLD